MLTLGTRGSQLALFQARAVAALLMERTGVSCEIVVIKTSGDRLAEARLSEIGGKRLFVKEIEDALLAGEIDLAVHSSKDMPAVLPKGLEIGAVLEREDPRDALVLRAGADQPGPAPRIGTSSVRRSAQLAALFPGARFEPIRGNLDTRLRKLDDGLHDALVLAAAGLRRLAHAARISTLLPIEHCVPAPGQGIIAVECRTGDQQVRRALAPIDDGAASLALRAERAVVMRLGGGCQMPIGAHAAVHGSSLTLTGLVIAPDGSRAARTVVQGSSATPEALGVEAADRMLAEGAGEILADVRRVRAPVDGLQP